MKLSKNNKIRLDILMIFIIMFSMSFVPTIFTDVFYETVTDCNYYYCEIESIHKHWTSQMYIWVYGGALIMFANVIILIIKYEEI